jgi:hypothetical protein
VVDILLLDGYQECRDNMPAGTSDSATAQRLDDVLALRDLVEQLQGVDLPSDVSGGRAPLSNACSPGPQSTDTVSPEGFGRTDIPRELERATTFNTNGPRNEVGNFQPALLGRFQPALTPFSS